MPSTGNSTFLCSSFLVPTKSSQLSSLTYASLTSYPLLLELLKEPLENKAKNKLLDSKCSSDAKELIKAWKCLQKKLFKSEKWRRKKKFSSYCWMQHIVENSRWKIIARDLINFLVIYISRFVFISCSWWKWKRNQFYDSRTDVKFPFRIDELFVESQS